MVSSNKYSGSTVNTPSLTINNVVLSDEASYVCFATNGVGTGQSSQTTVDVAGGKEIFYMIRIYVIFQHIFYINCGKSNDFLETVMWYNFETFVLSWQICNLTYILYI